MTPRIFKFKKVTPLCLIIFAVCCVALLPKVQAVSPPPDGGYPGGNTAEGDLALGSVTSGIYNTAVGIYSLLSVTTGNHCTGVGAGTLLSNTADENTATGAGALFSNSSGGSNTANGAFALFNNTTGGTNTANGAFALENNTTGGDNTAIGNGAMSHNTTGNVNTVTGSNALFSNTTGDGNTTNGSGALNQNTTGSFNTALGAQALPGNTTGSHNIALGDSAGLFLTTGDKNIDIGNLGVADESSTIRIGEKTAQTATFIVGISGTAVVGDAVVVDGNGQLGTVASSARFKKYIKPMNKCSEAILGLKPVSFRYKSDTKERPQFGLIAEEVAKVNPDLVVRDRNGEIYSVRYEAVNAMLLNEFLKEHQTVQELEKEVAALTAGLQKVSAQLEVSKPAPQTVLNNQ